jgi:MYXO-CTERM domain-containing protein
MHHLGKIVGLGAFCAVFGAAAEAGAVGEAINGFPNWNERVIHEWMNRARCDPKVEMMACGNNCPDGACYSAIAPLIWDEKLNHAARYHSAEMVQQNYFAHDSACTVVNNINSIYPGQCNGAASCGCVNGVKSCQNVCTTWAGRIGLFGANASGEIIASPADPNQSFYLWLFEAYNKNTCAFDLGPPTNGHRWNILKQTGTVGAGVTTADAVGDFGGGNPQIPKIMSGSHYPLQASSIDAWANWYDSAGPKSALIDVDGTCTSMSLGRGSVTNGAYTAKLAGLGAGCHRYYFLFKDSQNTIVTYPTSGSLGIGAQNCADWDSTRPAMGNNCLCTANCSNKVCGDDGCGGSCGTCQGNDMCVNGACVGGGMDGGGGGSDGGGGNTDGGGSGNDGGGGGGGGDGGGSGGGTDDGGGGVGDMPGGANGCSCDTAKSSSNSPWPAFALAALVLSRLRRRR